MMIEILLTLILFPLAVAGLALGTLLGRRGIIGSCGGLAHIPGIDSDCAGACRAAEGRCPNREHSAHRSSG